MKSRKVPIPVIILLSAIVSDFLSYRITRLITDTGSPSQWLLGVSIVLFIVALITSFISVLLLVLLIIILFSILFTIPARRASAKDKIEKIDHFVTKKIGVLKLQQFISPEHRAYREAGHVVMSYLLLKGFTNKYVPISRDGILTEFTKVTIEGENTDWTKTTSNLGSLMTMPQVLLAGYAAEKIKFDIVEDVSSQDPKLLESAWSLLDTYIDEYYETNNPNERHKLTESFLSEVYAYVEENLRLHWASVDQLADLLLEQKSVSKEEAFEIVEEGIPEDLKIKAKSELSRTTTEKLREVLKSTYTKD